MSLDTMTSVTYISQHRGAREADNTNMRRRQGKLAEEYAQDIAAQMDLARKAYGQQKQGSPAREASDLVNALLLEFDHQGGNLTELSEHLEGVITLAGLRRRMRVARAGAPLGQQSDHSFRGNKDPDKIKAAADKIREMRGTRYYGAAIREAKDDNLSLAAIARELDTAYYSLWSSMTTSGEKLAG